MDQSIKKVKMVAELRLWGKFKPSPNIQLLKRKVEEDKAAAKK